MRNKLSLYIRITIALSFLGIAACTDSSAASGASEDICMGCHERIRKSDWNNSAHKLAAIGCLDCHIEIDEVDTETGHTVGLEPPSCDMCHEEGISIEYETGARGDGETEIQACTVCHDPHKEPPGSRWNHEYISGITRIPFVDRLGSLMLLGSIGFVAVHGCIRLMTRRKKSR